MRESGETNKVGRTANRKTASCYMGRFQACGMFGPRCATTSRHVLARQQKLPGQRRLSEATP